jgi:hypothetical protein
MKLAANRFDKVMIDLQKIAIASVALRRRPIWALAHLQRDIAVCSPAH